MEPTTPTTTTAAMDSWVEPYVTGRLSPDDEERFEDYLLENPELARQVEDGLRLRRGMKRVATERTAVVLGGVVASRRRRPWIAAGVAAGLAVAASLVWFVPRIGDLERQLESVGSPRVGIPLVSLEATRSSPTAELPTLTLEGEPWVILTLEPSDSEGDFYLVHLERGAAAGTDEVSLWRSSPVATDALGRLVVTLPTDLLTTGPHGLRVEGIAGDGPAFPAGSFGFEVVRPGATGDP